MCLPAHSTQARARHVSEARRYLARRHPACRMCDMSSAGGSPHEACMRACLDHTPLYPPTLFHRPGARAPSQRAAGCLGSPCARTSRDLKCCSYLGPRFSRASLCSEGREGCLSPISVNFCPWSRLIRPPLSLSRHCLGAFPGGQARFETGKIKLRPRASTSATPNAPAPPGRPLNNSRGPRGRETPGRVSRVEARRESADGSKPGPSRASGRGGKNRCSPPLPLPPPSCLSRAGRMIHNTSSC